MRKLKALAGAVCLFLAAVAGAQDIREGRDYDVLSRVQPTDPNKIEVIEFFSYMCPHCAHFEPVIGPWAKNAPKDVAFSRIPVVFRPQWEPPARLFYVLEAMNEVDRLHVAAFNAIHNENRKMMTDAEVADWATKKGLDPKKFADVYNSFALQSKVQRGKQATAAYNITGVPAIVVAGKYRTPPENYKGSHEDLLKVVDALIAKVRNERKR